MFKWSMELIKGIVRPEKMRVRTGVNRTAMISHIIADVFRSRHWLFKTQKNRLKRFWPKKGASFLRGLALPKKGYPGRCVHRRFSAETIIVNTGVQLV
jgi:hypothetical protein